MEELANLSPRLDHIQIASKRRRIVDLNREPGRRSNNACHRCKVKKLRCHFAPQKKQRSVALQERRHMLLTVFNAATDAMHAPKLTLVHETQNKIWTIQY